MKQLAVILPGIGYHKDKPLLYYAAGLARSCGYAIAHIEYHDMPQKIRGNAEMMQQAAALAVQQTAEQMQALGLHAYDRILLIGKSIGTVAAAQYAAEHPFRIRQIWYTPLYAAFSFAPPAGSCTAFLGTADPWSDPAQIRQSAAAQEIPLYLYPDCNHSLECSDILRNIRNLGEIMQITADFIADNKN